MESGRKPGIISKTGSILFPFAVYYAVYMVSLVLFTYFMRYISGRAGQEATTAGIVNGISMLAGALALVPMLRAELRVHRREIVGDGGHSDGYAGRRQILRTAGEILITILLAAASSVGLNIFLTLTGFAQSSAGYQEVAQRQYGVAFGIGLFLYTVVSPLAEEIVFRGVVYNRMRRYFREWQEEREREKRRQIHDVDNQRRRDRTKGGKGRHMDAATIAAVMASGILFGIYHGNPVQAVYGGCLGMLMACLYERTHRFYVPCLFHAAANCTVYLLAQNAALQERIFTVPWCAALLVTAAAAVTVVYRSGGIGEIG